MHNITIYQLAWEDLSRSDVDCLICMKNLVTYLLVFVDELHLLSKINKAILFSRKQVMQKYMFRYHVVAQPNN